MIFILPVVLILLAISVFICLRFLAILSPSSDYGFFDITMHNKVRFLKVTTEINMAEFAANHKLLSRIPQGLERVFIHKTPQGIALEEINYKNIVFRNRKRLRKATLQNGDVIDFNGLCMMYNSKQQAIGSYLTRTKTRKGYDYQSDKVIEFSNNPVLKPFDPKSRVFLLDKNINYIGRSSTNDIVLRSPSINRHQAKIIIILGKPKLINLSSDGNIFVNGKRVEEQYLKDRDEVSFDSHKFRFFKRWAPNESKSDFVNKKPFIS